MNFQVGQRGVFAESGYSAKATLEKMQEELNGKTEGTAYYFRLHPPMPGLPAGRLLRVWATSDKRWQHYKGWSFYPRQEQP